MKNFKGSNIRKFYYVSIAFTYFILPSAIAMSRMGTANIINSNGVPCFSIPNNSETKNGLPLHGVFISELPNGDRDNLPRSVWSFRAADFNHLPTIFPKHCIPFGENPHGTTQRTFEPLELLKVYSVYIQTKHEGSSMIGYTGEFCIKPAGSGRTFVQVIAEDYSLGDSRFLGCVK